MFDCNVEDLYHHKNSLATLMQRFGCLVYCAGIYIVVASAAEMIAESCAFMMF
jgi:hypothetical protein